MPNQLTQNRWVSARDNVNIAGRDLGGMIYIGQPPKEHENSRDRDKYRAYIDPSLDVDHEQDDRHGNHMPYCPPNYAYIPPQSRASYLDWLASGRNDSSYASGYMLLYFYGLEHHFFIDRPHSDGLSIIKEVDRLRKLYPKDQMIQSNLGNFLNVAALIETDPMNIKPIYKKNRKQVLPILVKYAIGARLVKTGKLDADWLLSWLMNHPDSKLDFIDEGQQKKNFMDQFRMEFKRAFPYGMNVKPPQKSLSIHYKFFASNLGGNMKLKIQNQPIPDISELSKPLEIGLDMINKIKNQPKLYSYHTVKNKNKVSLKNGLFGDGLVNVRDERSNRRGESIPSNIFSLKTEKDDPRENRRTDVEREFNLDPELLKQKHEESKEASKYLFEIFNNEEENTDEDTCSTGLNLPSKYEKLLRILITKDHWGEDEFHQLCISHDLKAPATLEILNEWAAEIHDDIFIDEYEGYELSHESLSAIKEKLNIGENDVEIEAA